MLCVLDRLGPESEFLIESDAFVNTLFNKSIVGLLLSRTAELCQSF